MSTSVGTITLLPSSVLRIMSTHSCCLRYSFSPSPASPSRRYAGRRSFAGSSRIPRTFCKIFRVKSLLLMFVVNIREPLTRLPHLPHNICRLALGRLRFYRRRSCVSCQHTPVVFDALSHLRRHRLLGVTQVVGHLQVHPEFRGRFEKRSQPDRRVSCDASFILQNRRDPVGRHPDRLREHVCRQAQRFQKLLVENFTRRNGSHSILLHFANRVRRFYL